MTNISLDGKVAIITGAGRGLGREYALLFAARGARVIVNDLGSAVDGSGSSLAVAHEVVDLIRSRGGNAVANSEDVSKVEGGKRLVQQALDVYGRLDTVVNNAGNCGNKPFSETTLEDFEHYWRIHLGGHVNVTSAAWPIMMKQQHGRIIATASTNGLYGQRGLATYAAAKGAIHGLMRTLAIEGAEHGILVNSICPGAFSRMHEAAHSDPAVLDMLRKSLPAELVAPAVVWLASDACQVSGEEFSVWSGRIVRVAIGTGRGFFDPLLSPELIAENWDQVSSTADFYEPVDGVDDFSHWQAMFAEVPES